MSVAVAHNIHNSTYHNIYTYHERPHSFDMYAGTNSVLSWMSIHIQKINFTTQNIFAIFILKYFGYANPCQTKFSWYLWINLLFLLLICWINLLFSICCYFGHIWPYLTTPTWYFWVNMLLLWIFIPIQKFLPINYLILKILDFQESYNPNGQN